MQFYCVTTLKHLPEMFKIEKIISISKGKNKDKCDSTYLSMSLFLNIIIHILASFNGLNMLIKHEKGIVIFGKDLLLYMEIRKEFMWFLIEEQLLL